MTTIRAATVADIPALSDLIARSVRTLQRNEYDADLRESALRHVYGVDSALIDDGTYFVVEVEGQVAACGGWSKRRTAHGGDAYGERDDAYADPRTEPAKVRSFFVDPAFARRGIGALLLRRCEEEATAAGFSRFAMTATRTGVPFYERFGYRALGPVDVPLADGRILPCTSMYKNEGRRADIPPEFPN